ncbi:lipoxygenase family protein [Sorangium sp. So ce1335]|uniref:lipoxygenase family protein n=1 Tax=Sorangium sp. So ce1335 TaxID=3133335 RepID=UPI003F62903C
MSFPSLPQKDAPAEQQQRKKALARAQQTYVYAYNTRLAPLGVAKSVPDGQGFAPILVGSAALVVLDLVGNVVAKASKLVGPDGSLRTAEGAPMEKTTRDRIQGVFLDLKQSHRDLARRLTPLHAEPERAPAPPVPPPPPAGGPPAALRGAVAQQSAPGAQGSAAGIAPGATELSVDQVGDLIKRLLKTLLSDAGKLLLDMVGMYGQATSVYAYASEFQTFRLPEIASVYQDDATFAWMRVAGPNPLVIRRVPSPGPSFPVTDAQFRSVMGEGDSLASAGEQGRLYLADYNVLSQLEPGKAPDRQKYVEAPLALFAVPAAGSPSRQLRPVAIQCAQTPGAASPIFTPSDGVAWEVAKLHVQVADGNYHEMISHLGQTHLLIEAFAMATPRQLAPQHPVNVLLTPHFQGTLAINNAAEADLIAPEGPVDNLLAGTIASSTKLAVDSVLSYSVNQQFLPVTLEGRGVDDPSALPSYPYRDDALLLWGALHTWVSRYLAVYYASDADVLGDYELQGWLAELSSSPGSGSGCGLKDIGEDGAIRTVAYLANLLTHVIFTASAQHAAVNFPQSSLMSFTPALPLAAYAPAPSVTTGLPPSEIYQHLPPLEQALLQLNVMQLLGGVYYSRLGDYDRNIPGTYFTDPRIREPLEAFQRALIEIEATIGKRNLQRFPYIVLLPSQIPQSINI